jgi:hypothetical protein
MQVLARATAAASNDADTVEKVLATIVLPAGLLGISGGVQVQSTWSMTNSANSKTVRLRLGGLAGTLFLSAGLTTSAVACDLRSIRNRASASVQIGSYQAGAVGGTGSNSGTLPTGAINTAVAQDLVLTGQKASAGETLTLEDFAVWAMP